MPDEIFENKQIMGQELGGNEFLKEHWKKHMELKKLSSSIVDRKYWIH